MRQTPRKHWKSSICLLNVNTQSIRAKKLEFQYMVEDAKPDIIIACGTWFKPNINSSEIHPRYDPPFRNDRADGYGGVMIATKTGLVAERISIMSPCEMVGVKIQTAQPDHLVVFGVYRPTYNNSDYTNCTCDAISSIARKFPNSPLWIAGDTNLPDVNWQTNTISKHQYSKQINELFIDTSAMLSLSQMVTFPTRLDNTLDVFLTNRPSLVNRCEPIPGVSDHDLRKLGHRDKKTKTFHIWKKADTELIKEDIGAFAEEMQTRYNPETPLEKLWALFTAKCQKRIGQSRSNKTVFPALQSALGQRQDKKPV